MSTEPIRYTAGHMDGLIRSSQKYKSQLRKNGKLDEFNRVITPVAPKASDQKTDPVTHDSYCVKCKTKRTVETKKVHQPDPTKAGRAIGDCPVCGTETHAFVSGDKAQQLSSSLQSTLATTGGV